MLAHISSYTADYGSYRPFLNLLTHHGIQLDAVRANALARKSDESSDLALEQAGKAFGVMSHTEVDLGELLEKHPVEGWLEPEVREQLNIIDVRLHHITPFRFAGGSRTGSELIGHLLVYRSVAIAVVANSGFTSVLDEQKAPLNPYAELVIQLMKATRAAAGPEAGELRLRVADDRQRKGRLAVSLGRLDNFRRRLRFEVWYGATRMSNDAWAQMLESISNETNEIARTAAVTGMLSGRLRAVQAGNLPAAEANLPPTLCHRTDPGRPGIDPRIRNSAGHLETFHAVEIQPALAEYLTAYARGATDAALAVILRKHRVPTPRQLTQTKKDGTRKTSAQRDTTFDQLPFPEAVRRARRWMTYQSHPLRPVPDGGDPATELTNTLAVRKLQLVSEGESVYKWKNPTPTETAYEVDEDGFVPVRRETSLDDGYLDPSIVVGFPDKHVITVEQRWIDETGAPTVAPADPGSEAPWPQLVDVPVVTDEVVVDQDGHPVEWIGWGIDPVVVWLCAERLWRCQAEGSSDTHTNGRTQHDRLLGTPRWWEYDEDGKRVREWMLWRRGSTQKDVGRIFRHRWLIWRRPDQSWTQIRDGLAAGKANDGSYAEHHVSTINEGHAVKKLAAAMEDAVRRHLGGDVVLQAPATADRELRLAAERAELESQIGNIAVTITQLEEKLEGREIVAARKKGEGDVEETATWDGKVDETKADLAEQRGLQAAKQAELARVGEDDPAETFGAAAFETVADLIALLRKAAAGTDWATRRGPGELPADLARRIAAMFTDWSVQPPVTGPDGATNCRFACTWTLTMADGTVRSLPLTGMWTNTQNGLSAKNFTDTEIVRRMLIDGARFEDVATDLVVDTSREALWRNRARPLLASWGIPRSLRAPLYDSPSATTKQIVAVMLGGATAPQTPPWNRALATHITSTYNGTLRTRWNESAVPTDTGAMHAVVEMVAQHPAAGVEQLALHAVQPGLDTVSKHMITPTTNKRRTQPQMLEWRDTGVVGLIPCPHDDCPQPGSYAGFVLYLPETVPGTDGSIGGVLCRACRRLPRTDTSAAGIPFREIRFTPDYLELRRLSGARYRERGVSVCAGITHQLQTVDVAQVPAATHGTIARISRELNLTRYKARQLVADLPYITRKTAPGGTARDLYELAEVARLAEMTGCRTAA